MSKIEPKAVPCKKCGGAAEWWYGPPNIKSGGQQSRMLKCRSCNNHTVMSGDDESAIEDWNDSNS